MTAQRLRPALSIALVVPLSVGCASVSPKAAFRDTASLVEERSGRRIAWARGGDNDAAIDRRVHELLARPLDVETAVQVALLNNRTLRATYEELSVAQADLVQAGLLQNPVLGAGLLFPIAGNAVTGGSLSVTEDFLGIFLLAARKKIAGAHLRATELRVADAVLRAAYEVAAAFYGLAAAQEIATMRRTIVEAGDAAIDLARRQREAGNISELDLVSQEAVHEQLRTDLVRSDADVVAARESLTRLLGVWGADESYRVSPALGAPPPEERALESVETHALGRRLDLAAAHEESVTLARALSMTKATRWLGGAAVGATYERAPEGFTVAGPSLELELPLFDQKQAAVARLEAALWTANAKETALAVDVRSEVRAGRARVLAMRAVVDRYDRVVVPLRERAVALSQEQYNAMLIGAYQLLQAKQSEVASRRERIEALRDYWIARAELERASGGASPRTEAPRLAADAGATR